MQVLLMTQHAILFLTAFKLDSSETTGKISSKLGIIYHHTKVKVIWRLVTSCLKIQSSEIASLMKKAIFGVNIGQRQTC